MSGAMASSVAMELSARALLKPAGAAARFERKPAVVATSIRRAASVRCSSQQESSTAAKSVAATAETAKLERVVEEPEHKDLEPAQAATLKLSGPGYGLLIGARIPKDYFVITGFGQTNEGGGVDPWETGSYDLALEDAGIQDFNVVPYTSVVPPEATEISFEKAKPLFHHGSVLECIIAQMNGVCGDRISAGVARVQLRRKSDGARLGGWAAEYKGHAQKDTVKQILKEDLLGIFHRRFKTDDYELYDEKYHIIEGEIKEGFGTVIAAICFVSFIYPLYPART